MSRHPVRVSVFPVLVLFLLVDVALRIWGVERVYRLITTRAGRRSAAPPTPADVPLLESATGALSRATRYYFRRRRDCLPKALSLYYLLRRHGVAVELCWGVRKYPFAGHTWVEYHGHVLAEPSVDVAEFQILSRIGGATPSSSANPLEGNR